MKGKITKQIIFWYKATTIHHTHGPFLFRLAQQVVEDDRSYYAFFEIPSKIGASVDKKKGELFFKLILFLKPTKILLASSDERLKPYFSATGFSLDKLQENLPLKSESVLVLRNEKVQVEKICEELEKVGCWYMLLDEELISKAHIESLLERYRGRSAVKIVHLQTIILVAKLEGSQTAFEEVYLIKRRWKPWKAGFFNIFMLLHFLNV